MKAMNSRSIVAVTAVVAFLALLCLTAMLTTAKPNVRACPQCGSRDSVAILAPDFTAYECRDCGKLFQGPPRSDFSWVGAASELLGL